MLSGVNSVKSHKSDFIVGSSEKCIVNTSKRLTSVTSSHVYPQARGVRINYPKLTLDLVSLYKE